MATPNPSRNENLDRARRKPTFSPDPAPRAEPWRCASQRPCTPCRVPGRRSSRAAPQSRTSVMIFVLTLRRSDVQRPYQTSEPANLDP